MQKCYMKSEAYADIRLVDDVLSDADKISLFKRIQKFDFTDYFRKECKLDALNARERMVDMYVSILKKPVSQFKLGIPACEGQWVRFFQRMASYEKYHVNRETKHLPHLSLDDDVYFDGDDGTTNLDQISSGAWNESYDPIEAHDLWEYAEGLVDAVCEEQHCGEKVRKAVRMCFLEEAKPSECAAALKTSSNSVSQNLFRVRQGIAKSMRMHSFKNELERS